MSFVFVMYVLCLLPMYISLMNILIKKIIYFISHDNVLLFYPIRLLVAVTSLSNKTLISYNSGYKLTNFVVVHFWPINISDRQKHILELFLSHIYSSIHTFYFYTFSYTFYTFMYTCVLYIIWISYNIKL